MHVLLENSAITTVILTKLAATLSTDPKFPFPEETAAVCKRIIEETPTSDLYLLQQVRLLYFYKKKLIETEFHF